MIRSVERRWFCSVLFYSVRRVGCSDHSLQRHRSLATAYNRPAVMDKEPSRTLPCQQADERGWTAVRPEVVAVMPDAGQGSDVVYGERAITQEGIEVMASETAPELATPQTGRLRRQCLVKVGWGLWVMVQDGGVGDRQNGDMRARSATRKVPTVPVSAVAPRPHGKFSTSRDTESWQSSIYVRGRDVNQQHQYCLCTWKTASLPSVVIWHPLGI
jgi:hypothetical protein